MTGRERRDPGTDQLLAGVRRLRSTVLIARVKRDLGPSFVAGSRVKGHCVSPLAETRICPECDGRVRLYVREDGVPLLAYMSDRWHLLGGQP
jgi:hypothetical protein